MKKKKSKMTGAAVFYVNVVFFVSVFFSGIKLTSTQNTASRVYSVYYKMNKLKTTFTFYAHLTLDNTPSTYNRPLKSIGNSINLGPRFFVSVFFLENSAGIRKWIKFFDVFRVHGSGLRFSKFFV